MSAHVVPRSCFLPSTHRFLRHKGDVELWVLGLHYGWGKGGAKLSGNSVSRKSTGQWGRSSSTTRAADAKEVPF